MKEDGSFSNTDEGDFSYYSAGRYEYEGEINVGATINKITRFLQQGNFEAAFDLLDSKLQVGMLPGRLARMHFEMSRYREVDNKWWKAKLARYEPEQGKAVLEGLIAELDEYLAQTEEEVLANWMSGQRAEWKEHLPKKVKQWADSKQTQLASRSKTKATTPTERLPEADSTRRTLPETDPVLRGSRDETGTRPRGRSGQNSAPSGRPHFDSRMDGTELSSFTTSQGKNQPTERVRPKKKVEFSGSKPEYIADLKGRAEQAIKRKAWFEAVSYYAELISFLDGELEADHYIKRLQAAYLSGLDKVVVSGTFVWPEIEAALRLLFQNDGLLTVAEELHITWQELARHEPISSPNQLCYLASAHFLGYNLGMFEPELTESLLMAIFRRTPQPYPLDLEELCKVYFEGDGREDYKALLPQVCLKAGEELWERHFNREAVCILEAGLRRPEAREQPDIFDQLRRSYLNKLVTLVNMRITHAFEEAWELLKGARELGLVSEPPLQKVHLNSVDLMVRKANEAYNSGSVGQALEVLQQVLAVDPDNFGGRLLWEMISPGLKPPSPAPIIREQSVLSSKNGRPQEIIQTAKPKDDDLPTVKLELPVLPPLILPEDKDDEPYEQLWELLDELEPLMRRPRWNYSREERCLTEIVELLGRLKTPSTEIHTTLLSTLKSAISVAEHILTDQEVSLNRIKYYQAWWDYFNQL